MSGTKNKKVTPAPTPVVVVPPPVPPGALERLPDVYWLTRDKIGGVLMEVDVWVVEPSRIEFDDGDVSWLERECAEIVRARLARGAPAAGPIAGEETESDGVPLAVDEHDTCIDSWSVGEAKRKVGPGVPENARECLRVGEPPDRSQLS